MKLTMTVRLELEPDVEANLAAQARVKGLALDAYLQGVIEDLALTGTGLLASADDIRSTLDALAEMGKDLPNLSSFTLTREGIYQDHN